MSSTTHKFSVFLNILLSVAIIASGIFFYIEKIQAPNTSLNTDNLTTLPTPSTTSTTSSEVSVNISEWAMILNDQGKFTIQYPIDFPTEENYSLVQTQDWRLNGGVPGNKYVTISIPKMYLPQSNFSEAKLTIGASQNPKAISECFTPDNAESTTTTSTIDINGTQFKVFTFGGAGAGNLYEITSYRTVRSGQCFAIETTIHSGRIENYPESLRLHEFDKAKVANMLEKMVKTFKFN